MKRTVLIISLLLAAFSIGPNSFKLANANLLNGKSREISLELLCSGKQMDLKDDQDLSILIGQLKSATKLHNTCSNRVKHALEALNVLVNNRAVCSMAQANDLTKFVNNFLKSKPENELEDGEKLPHSLAKFAIAFGVRLSLTCKKLMLNEFMVVTNWRLRNQLGDSFFEQFQNNLVDQSQLSVMLAPIVGRGEIVLPVDLFELMPGLDQEVAQYLSSQDLDHLGAICANYLQPLYEPLLLPLAQIQRAGFNYKNIGNCKKKWKKMARFWSVATFLCETIKFKKSQKVVTNSDLTIQNDVSQMARELQPKVALQQNQCKRPADGRLQFEPFRIDPILKVMTIGRRSLKSATSLFDADKSELERLRDLIQERSFKVFKLLVGEGHLKRGLMKTLLNRKSPLNAEQLQLIEQHLIKAMDKKQGDKFESHKIAETLHTMQVSLVNLVGLVLALAITGLGFGFGRAFMACLGLSQRTLPKELCTRKVRPGSCW